MKTIKLFALVFFAFLLVGTVSAADWDNIKEFKDKTEAPDNGQINVYNSWLIPGVIKGDKIADITLVEHTYSMFTGYSKVDVKLFSEDKLMENTNLYQGTNKIKVDKDILNSFNIVFKRQVEKSREIEQTYQDCYEIENTNSTNQSTYTHCDTIANGSITKYYTEFEEFDYKMNDKVPAGNYTIELYGERNDMTTGMIDWTYEALGMETTEYATWWNNSWSYKREIGNLTGNISGLYTVPYNANMNVDFSDVIFLDSATNLIELNFSIANKVDSEYAAFRVNNLGETNVTMYYGNSGQTTSTENTSKTYFEPVSAYYFDNNVNDSVGSNDGTVNGATLTDGYINNSYDFDGGSDYITANSGIQTGDWSISSWFNLATSSAIFMANGETGNKGIGVVLGGLTTGKLNILEDGVNWGADSSLTYNDGNWHNIILTKSGNNYNLYADGGATPIGSYTNAVTSGTKILIGQTGNPTYPYYANGQIDEVMIYDRVLTQTEMTQLYTQTAPNFILGVEEENQGITTTLNAPIDNITINDDTVDFNFTITPSQVNTTNWTLNVWYANGTLEHQHINTTINTDETITIIHNDTLFFDNNYIWNVESCGIDGGSPVCDTAANETFVLHTVPPILEIIVPQNITYSSAQLQFEVRGDENLSSCNYSLDGASNQTMTEFNSTTFIENVSQSEGGHNVTFYCDDLFGNLNYTTQYYTNDLFLVSLISPEDNYKTFISELNFTTNVTSAEYGLKNISLWDNSTGVWLINQIFNFDIFDEFDDSVVNTSKWDVTTGGTNPGSVTEDGTYQIIESSMAIGGFPRSSSATSESINLFSGESFYKINFGNISQTANSVIGGASSSSTFSIKIDSNNVITNTLSSSDIQSQSKVFENYVIEIIFSESEGTISHKYYNSTFDSGWVNISGTASSVLSFETSSSRGGSNDGIGITIINVANFSSTNFYENTWNKTVTDDIIWNVQSCNLNDGCEFSENNRSLLVNKDGPIINITSPDEFHNVLTDGQNLFLNWTVETNGTLDVCSYIYNDTTTNISCLDNTTIFEYIVGINNITFNANDTLGNTNSLQYNWTVVVVFENDTSEQFVYETATESFSITIDTSINVLTIDSFLNYDGINYKSDVSCVGSMCILSNELEIPLVESGESKNNTFFYNFTIFNGTSSLNFQTSNQQQNVTRIHLEECNATYTVSSLNFTCSDEETGERINPFVFDGTFKYWIGSGDIYRNISISKNQNEVDLCILPGNLTYISNADIQYIDVDNSTEYIRRTYALDNEEITSTLKNISLPLLSTEKFTTFILFVQDENLLAVNDAYINIQRCDVGTGECETVQVSKTAENGKTVGFFEVETVDYKFIITKDGEIVLETEKGKVIPEQTPYTLTFTIGADFPVPWVDNTPIPELESEIEYDDSSNSVLYIYSDSSETFSSSNLVVQQIDLTNESNYVLVCNETSAFSSASLSCDLESLNFTSGNYLASTYITRLGTSLDEQITFGIDRLLKDSGLIGLFFGWFLLVVAAFLFKFNDLAGIWGLIVTVTLVNLTGLINFGTLFVSAIWGIGLIITWILER